MKPTKVIERGDLLFEEVVSDRLSSKIRSIKGKISSSDTFEDLVTKGENICNNITYLNEKLRLLEKNDLGKSIMLRSIEPDKNQGNIEYFEMILQQSGDISIDRYSYAKQSQERNKSDFILSHDLMERLVKDISNIE